MVEIHRSREPIGIIDSIGAGFSALTEKPALLLLPLLLDLFLWLGPRLAMGRVAPRLAAQMRMFTGQSQDNSALLFEQNVVEILGSYNLFSALSTWPLGTPSLLAGSETGATPLGSRATLQVHSVVSLLACLLLLVFLGLMLGSWYLSLIARYTNGDATRLRTWGRLVWLHCARIVLLATLVLMAAFFLSVPFFLILEIVAAVIPPVAPLLLLLGVGLGMWGLFHLLFAAHGILLYEMPVRQAMHTSVAVVRTYRASAAGLFVIAFVIGLGLTTVWNLPPSDSWMRLVAITGNAFVNTGLVTATFVYYRERTGDK